MVNEYRRQCSLWQTDFRYDRRFKSLIKSVHLDPVVPHFRPDARAGVGGEDDVGGLVREVAVDALALECAASAREETAALDLVAGEAASREILDAALGQVNVVTRRAGHV